MLPLLSPEVHDQLLCFVEIVGEVINLLKLTGPSDLSVIYRNSSQSGWLDALQGSPSHTSIQSMFIKVTGSAVSGLHKV